MKRSLSALQIASAAALLAALVISGVASTVFGAGRRTLFFPMVTGWGADRAVWLSAETRRVPTHGSLEANVRQLLEEVELGPAEPEHERLLGGGTRVAAVIVRRGTAYVDLTREILDADAVLAAERQIQALATAVQFNFPRVRRTFVLIDGRLPDFSRSTGDQAFDFRSGVPPSRELLR